jgi:hypothetical protein
MNNIPADAREQYAQHLKETMTTCYECELPKPHSEIIWRGRCRQCCVERLEWAVNNCDCKGEKQ